MKKTLILLAHPSMDESRINKALIEAISPLEHVTIHDLYAHYGSDPSHIDIAKEQALLEAHDRIVFQFPLFWYSTPSLLKGWQDAVLSYGFAFGANSFRLKGKEFKIVTTAGSAQESFAEGGYGGYSINEAMTPMRAMSQFTGMIYTRAHVLYGVMAYSEEQLQAECESYRALLQTSDWGNGRTKFVQAYDEFVAQMIEGH